MKLSAKPRIGYIADPNFSNPYPSPLAGIPNALRKLGLDFIEINPATATFESFRESIEKFKEVIKIDSKSEFADDAYYNIGLCYFAMMQFKKSIEFFDKVINEYPDATIALSEETGECGKIEAKARLGKINAYLAMGKVDSAASELTELEKFKDDSFIKFNDGNKKSFFELGSELIDNYKKA